MSSSVFFESNALRHSGVSNADSEDLLGFDGEVAATADSNLVVVYGKNSINFDRKGLDTLIEEKALSSISVIRLTSPTPSMLAEEEAAQELEKSTSEDGSANEEDVGDSALDDEHPTGDRDESNMDNDSVEDEAAAASENEVAVDEPPKPKKRGRKPKVVPKPPSPKRKRQRERPPIVGLTLEDFYPAADANKVIKEALKKAGMSPIKRTEEYEFQLYVIKNDHCYTPFTSPEQLRAQAVFNKLELERQTTQAATTAPPTQRKTPAQMVPLPAKPKLFGRKKEPPAECGEPAELEEATAKRKNRIMGGGGKHGKMPPTNEKSTKRDTPGRGRGRPRRNDFDEFIADDEEPHSSTADDDDDHDDGDDTEDATAGDEDEIFGFEYFDDSEFDSEKSLVTDNDRDSDLDFNVTKRKGLKRGLKMLQRGGKHRSATKAASRRQHKNSQDDSDEVGDITPILVSQRSKTHRVSADGPRPAQKSSGGVAIVSMLSKTPDNSAIRHASHKMGGALSQSSNSTSSAPAASSLLKKHVVVVAKNVEKSPKMFSPQQIRRGPIVQLRGGAAMAGRPAQRRVGLPHSVNINKVMASPKGGFTDISDLLNDGDDSDNNSPVRIRHIPHGIGRGGKRKAISPQVPSAKGFTPLGIESATRHQLPSQISIQTHQSHTELAAEHDKQLDLIDSIVQNELKQPQQVSQVRSAQKAGVGGVAGSGGRGLNENIPELVKMLESTEQALETQTKRQLPVKSDDDEGDVDVVDEDDVDVGHDGDGGDNHNSGQTDCHDDNNDDDVLHEDDDVLDDLSNARLLDTADDDIPEDLLKQVVELIEDDKTLAEAVEKQVFGGGSLDEADLAVPMTPPPLAPIFSNMKQRRSQQLNKSVLRLEEPAEVAPTKQLPQQQQQKQSETTAPLEGIQTPKTTPLVRREPIRVVRGNGRVITLPPIEAPTTRAMRRAQVLPSSKATAARLNSTAPAAILLNDSSLDSSIHSNCSLNTANTDNSLNFNEKKMTTAAIGGGGGSVSSVSSLAGAQQARRRGSVREELASNSGGSMTAAATSTPSDSPALMGLKKKRGKRGGGGVVPAKNAAGNRGPRSRHEGNDAETESQDGDGDDDDPNKLWCVCRQPHNNRFMICCDMCEDWFHGTCVNITKAMGLEMEQKSIDWTCPKCVKMQEERKQRKITDMLPIKVKETAEVGNINMDVTADNNVVPAGVASGNKRRGSLPQQPPPEAADIGGDKKPAAATPKHLEQAPKKFPGLQAKKSLTASPATTTTPKRLLVTRKSTSAGKTPPAARPTSAGETDRREAAAAASAVASGSPCVVCHKATAANSIYCGDECIRKHAQNALSFYAKPLADTPTVAAVAQTTTVSPLIKIGAAGTATAVANVDAEKKRNKGKGLFEDLLLLADRKPKAERVYVFERRTGRVLTGNSAPTTHNLKKWLHENPTYEVVQPGSPQAIEIEKRQKQRAQNSSSPLPALAQPAVPATSPPVAAAAATIVGGGLTKPVKYLLEQQAKNSPPGARAGQTPKQLQKYPQQVSIRPDSKPNKSQEAHAKTPEEKRTAVKRQNSEASLSTTSSLKRPKDHLAVHSEPIRLNVRRTLKEQLLQRMNEPKTQDDPGTLSPSLNERHDDGDGEAKVKLTVAEIEKFVNETEAQMYDCFNRDTGAKYKAKYRSLMFNIRDRKNRTLFAKICARQVEPRQLVRMSPEELASQELAQWREQETKHQLEMITKSELDMLQCSKNYVLKSHKGEEVIEETGDTGLPVEDMVSVLNKSAIEALDDSVGSSASHKEYSLVYNVMPLSVSSNSPATTMTPEDGGAKDDTRHDQERRHKSKEHHHHSQQQQRDRSYAASAGGKRSHSRSRSRSRSREKRHKSGGGGGGGHRSRDHDREHKEGAGKPTHISVKGTTANNSITASQKADRKESRKSGAGTPNKPTETFSLIDQILDGTKTIEEAANLVTERKERTNATGSPLLTHKSQNRVIADIAAAAVAIAPPSPAMTESSITVAPSSSPPELSDEGDDGANDMDQSSMGGNPYAHYAGAAALLWSGNINMIDVASFRIAIQPVLGNCANVGKLLPRELDVVGRIGPDTVWDYISKIQRSPNKEIVIVRLLPEDAAETTAYGTLYEYLDKRQRLGVIKTNVPQIKDFYMYPLGVGQPIPAVLQPVERVEFYEDPQRPDMLLGIIIRVIVKRSSGGAAPVSGTLQSSSAGAATNANAATLKSRQAESNNYTPPGSPTAKRKKRSRNTAQAQVEEMDMVDAIIKGSISTKHEKSASQTPARETASSAATASPVLAAAAANDDDEPYSPGGSSDELPASEDAGPGAMLDAGVPDAALKRKMDELNRKIAARELEIAGLLEPSRSSANAVLANISIPSNLSQILASIKSKPEQNCESSAGDGGEARAVVDYMEYEPERVSHISPFSSRGDSLPDMKMPKSSSRLAQLSEAELLSMVPHGMMNMAPTSASGAPPLQDIDERIRHVDLSLPLGPPGQGV